MVIRDGRKKLHPNCGKPMSVAQLARLYMTEHGSHKKSVNEDSRQLHKYVVPRIGHLEVAAVNYEHISAIHKRMRASPIQANRTLSLLSKLFSMAEIWGWRDPATNPCRGIRRFRETKRRRYMTDKEAPILRAILERHNINNPKGVAFIRLLLLTGARPAEIAAARISWIDGHVMSLPDSKTGERTIYLPEGVPELFEIAGPPRRQIPKKLWLPCSVM